MALEFLKKFTGSAPASKKIWLYNTLTSKKEVFSPIKSGEAKMYNCGPTVYDFQHIGNYRVYVFADTLKRVLLESGFKVYQVINITDVGHLTGDNSGDANIGEDKIEKGAQREKKTVKEIIELYTGDFLENLKKLNIDTETIIFPRATEHILEQIAFIKTLEEKGYTYSTKDGIYFDSSLFKNYGKLGNIDIAGLKEGSRVERNPERRRPSDFALWKFSKPEDKRSQEWDSPWGRGFPGWHIECSAMSTKYLGKTFDLHTGGIDHIPVHHNNEIAQSESATGRKFVNYWMHVAHLRIENQKISKSLGNSILIKNLEEKGVSPLAYRYWLLTAHYRSPLNFTWEAIDGANKAFFRLQKTFVEQLGPKIGKPAKKYTEMFELAMRDDLDTPKAIAVMHEMLKDSNVSAADKKASLLEFDKYLGLNLTKNQETMEELLGIEKVSLKNLEEPIKSLVLEREAARKTKDWKKADSLRKELKDLGYEVEDSETGPKITKKS